MIKPIFRGQNFDVDIKFDNEIITKRFFAKNKTQIPKEFKRIYNQGKIIKIKSGTKFYR